MCFISRLWALALKSVNKWSQVLRQNSLHLFRGRGEEQNSFETRIHSSRICIICYSIRQGLGCILACNWQAVCIPACTGQGVCVSQHALGRGCVSQKTLGRGCVYPSMHWIWGICPGGCLPGGVSAQGGLIGGSAQCMLGYSPPPCEQNDRHLWKHNLAATTLWTAIRRHGLKLILR